MRVTYNTPPNTPTNTTPASGATSPVTNPTFTWSAFSDPNAGDTQSQFQVQVAPAPGRMAARAADDSGTRDQHAPILTLLASFNSDRWQRTAGMCTCAITRTRATRGAVTAPRRASPWTPPRLPPARPLQLTPMPRPLRSRPHATDAGSGVANVQTLLSRPNRQLDIGQPDQRGRPLHLELHAQPGNGTYYFQSRRLRQCRQLRDDSPPGNTGTGDDNTIYDTVAPTSAATPPAGPINVGTIAVPWTASDATSGIATNGVTLYYNYNWRGLLLLWQRFRHRRHLRLRAGQRRWHLLLLYARHGQCGQRRSGPGHQ